MREQLKKLSAKNIKDSPEINNWLSQFSNNDKSVAKSLLMHLEFVSLNQYSKWLKNEIQSLSNDKLYAFYAVRKFPDHQHCLWDNNGEVINRPGASLGSEDFVYSLIASEVRANQNSFFDHPSLLNLKDKHIHNIILLDDSIGSGQRVSTFLASMFTNKSFKSWWSYNLITIYIISFIRSNESELEILSVIPGHHNSKVRYFKNSRILFKSSVVYNKDYLVNRWGKKHEDIMKLCENQRRIPIKFRFGFDKMMSNVIFYHSVPNNIPGILFCTNKGCIPLFSGRTVPDWLFKILEGDSKLQSIQKIHDLIPEDIIKMLLLIKNGIRCVSSIAMRIDRDIESVKRAISNAISSGFILQNMRITKVGIDLLNDHTRKSITYDRTIYIPKSWRTDQTTTQLPNHEDEEAYPTDELSSVGGETGQVSLERTDAKAASPPVNINFPSHSMSHRETDGYGPLDSKDR
jgi:hypothetical protein